MPVAREILYEKHGDVAVVTINRPEKLNACTIEMFDTIEECMREADRDDAIRVAILTGAGDKAFSSGADLEEAIPMLTSGARPVSIDPTKRLFSDVFKPIICAVNGMCIAGGMELLLGTDIRIAAEHATFALGEVRWGIVPAGGTHIRLVRQIPWAVAMEMLLTGRPIDAKRAFDIGLVNQVVPLGELMDTAMQWARTIARNGPLAVRTAKEIAVRSLALEPAFVVETLLAERVMRSEDAKEGPRAFAERRQPQFKGR